MKIGPWYRSCKVTGICEEGRGRSVCKEHAFADFLQETAQIVQKCLSKKKSSHPIKKNC
jgi:hypothetical protein